MQPKMLILDEPTAGLDPFGKEQILNLIKYLKTHCSPTIVVISHDIDEITRFANRIVVFNDSRIVYDEPMQQLFKHSIQLQNMGLDIPKAVKIANAMRDRGIDLGEGIVTAEDLMAAIVERYNEKHATQIDKKRLRIRYVRFFAKMAYLGRKSGFGRQFRCLGRRGNYR